jgi:hypothetical protein
MGESNDHTGEKPRSARGDDPTGASRDFGGLAELAGYVFTSGARSDNLRRTHEAMAEHAGRTVLNETDVLVLDGYQQAPEMQDNYDTSQGLTFPLILGQCHPVLNAQLASNADFKNLQTANDVAGQTSFLTQHDNDSHDKLFITHLAATEEVKEMFIPDRYRNNSSGTDCRRYKTVIDELNDSEIKSMSPLMSRYRCYKSGQLDAYTDGGTLTPSVDMCKTNKQRTTTRVPPPHLMWRRTTMTRIGLMIIY